MIRKTLFWLHLIAGLTGGLLIAVMSFTGAALTFEKDLIAWAERDARRVEPPAGATRLPLAEILERTRAAQPELRVTAITISADPSDAIALGAPNNRTFCVNPFTGEVREALAPRMRSFLQTMRGWHTQLAIAGKPGSPSPGAQLNSAANLLFVFLGLSGLVLWWPSAWKARVLRPSLWFNRDARGRARDWNWHNVIGFWSLPIVLVLAGTGIVLSYRWANEVVFRLAGDAPPTNLAPPPPPPIHFDPAPPSQAPLSSDALIAAAQKSYPDWTLVTLRFSPAFYAPKPNNQPPRAVSVVVKERQPWPRFDTVTLTLDALTGEVKRTENFATLSAGLRARRWIRLLHSGEAFGRFIQFLSGLACVGGCVLVYTGFALAWRRFFSRSLTTRKTSP